MKTFRERTQLDDPLRAARASPTKLPPRCQLALFRVLQECLSNAVKHAEPEAGRGEARTSRSTGSHLVGQRRRQGLRHRRQTSRGHYGLINMRERAHEGRRRGHHRLRPRQGRPHLVLSAGRRSLRTVDPHEPRPAPRLRPSASTSSRTRRRSSRTSSSCSRASRDIEIVGTALSGETALEEVPQAARPTCCCSTWGCRA